MSETGIFFSAEFWVLVAFILFVVLLVRLNVHKSGLSAIDQRNAKIQAELDQAKSLREEAQRVLAEYTKRRAEAEQEAAGIVEAAKTEATRLAAEAKTKTEEFVVRRTQMAEDRIKLAEAQAVADVRAAAADAAAAAAEIVLSAKVTGQTAEGLLDRGIADLKARFQ